MWWTDVPLSFSELVFGSVKWQPAIDSVEIREDVMVSFDVDGCNGKCSRVHSPDSRAERQTLTKDGMRTTFTCASTGKSNFRSLSSASPERYHSLVSVQGRLHSCRQCTYVTKYTANMKRHIRTHTGFSFLALCTYIR
ncbi:uncharacterized protein LOC119163775 isoform X2 [Rhipicephalus microplus]|uniref:uncharacterized protein LOC119163775 isoform X2 n=1 Tax=Rhipicephalus microplus TaxID=6941 RepID=UPI003F6D4F53